jgi:hypothetical protein
MAFVRSYGDCLLGFYPEIMNIISTKVDLETANARTLATCISETLNEWEELVKGFLNSPADQFSLIQAIEIYCMKNEKFSKTFHLQVQVLCNLYLLENSTVLKWAKII